MDLKKAVMTVLANWASAAVATMVLLIVIEWLMPGSVLPFFDVMDWLWPAALICAVLVIFATSGSLASRIVQIIVLTLAFALALAFLAARMENYGTYSLIFLLGAGLGIAVWAWSSIRPET